MKYFELAQQERALKIIALLQRATKEMPEPASAQIVKKYGRDPYLILISCLLSLRAKDTASLPASLKLFELARTPEALLALPISEIEKCIYSVGFYRQKARTLHEVSAQLLAEFDGIVPGTEQGLLRLKGVGRKTANLVLSMGFAIPAICVDIHVHRISNRLGLVSTKTPEETERALQELLPKEHWSEFNHLLVMWGQNVCGPVSPKCSECPLAKLCPRVGVTRSR